MLRYKILGFNDIKRPIFIVLAQKPSVNITFCPTNFAKEAPPMDRAPQLATQILSVQYLTQRIRDDTII